LGWLCGISDSQGGKDPILFASEHFNIFDFLCDPDIAPVCTDLIDMMNRDMDKSRMLRAIDLAHAAMEMGEIPVGAILVDGDGNVIAQAHNRTECDKNPLAHAEMLAITEGCKRVGDWRLRDCTLYVTLEPCPMCMGAILHARIGRVVYGSDDPRAGAAGSVLDLTAYPLEASPTVEGGLLADEARSLLQDFFRNKRKNSK
jgi:tRNA(adenine34) deaminase